MNTDTGGFGKKLMMFWPRPQMMNFGRGGKDALTTVLRPLGINVSDTDSSDCSSDTSLDSSSSSSLDDAPLQHILSRLYAMDPVRTSVVGEKRVSDRRLPLEKTEQTSIYKLNVLQGLPQHKRSSHRSYRCKRISVELPNAVE